MAYDGLQTFLKNIDIVMDSDVFKRSNDIGKFNIGYKLLKSRFGLGGFFGIKKIPIIKK